MRIQAPTSFLIIAVCLPLVLWATILILPTFDDFTTLQSPQFTPWISTDLLPNNSFWRPWDYLFGCLLGRHTWLFPSLNHAVIVVGHTVNSLLVYKLCRKLHFTATAANIATLYFFFSPATLGTILACDGLNQTFAQLWGLMALWIYLDRQHWLWLLCIVLAVLSKENGLAWAVVPPLIAYAFKPSSTSLDPPLIPRGGRYSEGEEAPRVSASLRGCLVGGSKGLLVAVAYFAARLILSVNTEVAPDYTSATLADHATDLVQLLAYTWVPLDYMSAVYPPTRNWVVVAITLLTSLPFLVMLARKWPLLKTRQLLVLIACFFILVSPHLITLVSIMHNYAALSMAALIIAFIVSRMENTRMLKIAFALYLATALFTDLHHYQAARQSGLLGKQLAMQVINQTEKTPNSVFCISIDDERIPRYSSFCVPPVNAFAWGLSVPYYSHYTWKPAITSIVLPHYDQQQVQALADSVLNRGQEEAVWVVGHDSQKVIILKKK